MKWVHIFSHDIKIRQRGGTALPEKGYSLSAEDAEQEARGDGGADDTGHVGCCHTQTDTERYPKAERLQTTFVTT